MPAKRRTEAGEVSCVVRRRRSQSRSRASRRGARQQRGVIRECSRVDDLVLSDY